VQVDPIKPTLKEPGSKRLKLKYDGPLSNFGFNFSLRRYIVVSVRGTMSVQDCITDCMYKVGWCRLTVSNPVLKAPMVAVLETIIL